MLLADVAEGFPARDPIDPARPLGECFLRGFVVGLLPLGIPFLLRGTTPDGVLGAVDFREREGEGESLSGETIRREGGAIDSL